MIKKLDFAMLFTMDGGSCSSAVSVFDTAALGVYAGNRLAPQELLEAEICSMVGREVFDGVRDALPEVLSAIIGDVYNGSVGVDMMAVDNRDYAIAPAVELNLRNTMVCVPQSVRPLYRAGRCRTLRGRKHAGRILPTCMAAESGAAFSILCPGR